MLFFGLMYGKQIDEAKAKQIGLTFLSGVAKFKNISHTLNLKLVFESSSNNNNSLRSPIKNTFFFVFSTEQSGFVIIAGDDRVTPILGYSDQNKFEPDHMPEHIASWFEEYEKQIQYIIDNKIEPNDDIVSKWNLLSNGHIGNYSDRTISSVEPLMKTKWNQRPYVNDLCPGKSVTGCGATAMAQIMKYWNYPKTGTGFHSYYHETYGTLSVNFANTTYDWNNMPNVINNPNSAVATLMYHCGVAQSMEYTTNLSTSGLFGIRDAFENYFGYKKSLDSYNRINYTDENWKNLLKGDLDTAKPIFYRGAGTGGGHFFILDGYDNNNFFHINWGWGGQHDGYFLIDALNPGGVGIGGGTGGYNSGHYALLGVVPDVQTGTYDLSLYAAIGYNPDPITSSSPINVTVQIVNRGTSNFTGDICAAIFTKAGDFVNYVQILENKVLQNGFFYNYTFTNSGINLVPGNHTIAIYFKLPDKDWILLKPSTFTNPIEVNVPEESNNLKIYSKISINSLPIVQGQPFNIIAEVVNRGTTKFEGWISAEILDKNGKWIQTIYEYPNLNLNPGFFFQGLSFASTGISLPPGSYYIAIWSSPDYKKWTVISSNGFENPVAVNITSPAISPDKYENNNTPQTAHNLIYTFSSNTTSILTTGSNLHNQTDYDFYKVVLPPGYDYTLNAKVGDRFNNINTDSYDADVLFSFDYGNGSSGAYDDFLYQPVTIRNGGTLIFYIAPYAAGETGSYILDVNLTRSVLSSSEDLPDNSKFSLFPNPANNEIFIETKSLEKGPNTIKIYSNNGQLMRVLDFKFDRETRIRIDVKDLNAGAYFLQLQHGLRTLISKSFSILR